MLILTSLKWMFKKLLEKVYAIFMIFFSRFFARNF